MSFPRIVVLGSTSLFFLIGFLGVVKKVATKGTRAAAVHVEAYRDTISAFPKGQKLSAPVLVNGDFPKIDRMEGLFSVTGKLLPIVETIVYTSSVPWLKGRPAWISDYATHFSTSRHFIARSLSDTPNYLAPKVFQGNRFNVFRSDKQVQFCLVVDQSRCKMGLYYYDLGRDERVLLKVYSVGLGKQLKDAVSMTPMGLFPLGDNVGIYNKGMMGYYLDKKIEMIQVFGTRWIPFGEKGLGIQGAPWVRGKGSELREDLSSIGKYESDGCIRMAQEDVEELYAIVVTRPTFIQVVEDVSRAQLPGKEVDTPTR